MIGNNRAEQELTKLLASTLVQKEVMEPMEKHGWRHGTPPPPDYGTTPQVEGAPATSNQPTPNASTVGQPTPNATDKPAGTVAKADAPASAPFEFNPEDFKDATSGKYLGKYDSPAELMRGLGHLANMAKTAFSERDAAKTRLAEIEAEHASTRSTTVGSPLTAPTSSPVTTTSRVDVDRARVAYDAVLSQVAEDGGVLDAESAKKLSAAQSELSRQEAKYALAESREQEKNAQTQENARWQLVTEYMEQKYPKANQFADEIGLHVQTDPVLAEAVAALIAQGKEIRASELAWLSFERTMNASGSAITRAEAEKTEEELAAREQVRKEATARARADAGIVSGSAGGVGIHENPTAGGSSREEIAQLASEMARQGDAPGSPAAARWRHAVIGRFLDPSLFGGN